MDAQAYHLEEGLQLEQEGAERGEVDHHVPHAQAQDHHMQALGKAGSFAAAARRCRGDTTVSNTRVKIDKKRLTLAL